MKTRLAALAALAALLTALATWAFAQPSSGGAWWEQHGRDETSLIDDVDREALKRAQTRRQLPRVRDRGRPHVESNHLTLIDDVDREAQRRAALERAAKAMERGPVGRYAVSACDKRALLVDTVTGKTWILSPSGTARPSGVVWLPIERIDDEEALRRKPRREEPRDNAAEGQQSKQ